MYIILAWCEVGTGRIHKGKNPERQQYLFGKKNFQRMMKWVVSFLAIKSVFFVEQSSTYRKLYETNKCGLF